MSTETDLRERLHRIAEATAPPEDPHLATRIAATSRARRRRRMGLTALVAGVAALVVAVPAVLPGPADGPAAPTGSPAAVDVLTGPTRGSLAGDTDFVEGVRRLPWVSYAEVAVPTPPLETRRVVWAGDVPGGRWALVAGENTARPAADPALQTDEDALSDTAVLWFAGPPGADATEMRPASAAHGADVTHPVALTVDSTGALVVVAAPGDTVEFSRRPDVAADATVTRTWEPVETDDGVAVTSVGESNGPPSYALRYRVLRDGAQVVLGHPESLSAWSGGDFAPDAVEWLRGEPEPSSELAPLAGNAQDLLLPLGLPYDEVDLAVVWAGPVPSPDQARADVALLAATLPSGAIYLKADATVSRPDGSGGGAACGSALQAAGPSLLERTYVLSCPLPSLGGGVPGPPTLVVVAPPAATTARLLDAGGTVLGSYALQDGVVVGAPVEGLATVQTLAADGTVLAETAPLGDVEWG